MKIVIVSASPRKNSNTRIIMKYVVEYVGTKHVDVQFIDLLGDQVEPFKGHDVEYNETTKKAANDLMEADVWLIGTPIYNSFFSSALKNLFEYVDYKKTEGKVAGITIVAAGNIGFIDVQTLVTQLLSYFRIIANPKAVFITTDLISNNDINEDGKKRLREMVDNTLNMATKLHK